MRQAIAEQHDSDAEGMPTGGWTTGLGIEILWQNGPLGRDEDRREPNGAFVEGVISAAIGRLEYYQSTRFNCEENARALQHLIAARDALDERTANREAREVEGTHAV